jgi:hypothetical protein
MLLGLHHRAGREGSLKIYEQCYGDIQTAITRIEEDRKTLGVARYLDFAGRSTATKPS